MEKIVTKGMKIDLHIHSCASAHKDGRKVKNNTKENIGLLIQRLNENDVNICSITDHDIFSYEMYSELKKAEKKDNSILKVLPGVEFSVRFSTSAGEEIIHIVAIFSDCDDKKIKNIEEILKRNRPDETQSYKEEAFLSILREIDINTVLIAHQKNSLSSTTTKKNDVMRLGKEKFYELVFSDYFEAFEFKNKRNEIINKSFLESNGLHDSVRFVTGTDCHDWSVYPREDESDQSLAFPYTYAKCLPTFKGLVMAMTDYHRLNRVDSFFNADKVFLDSIKVEIDKKTIVIPLSKGINVIIGDNSIGKSMLLHAITGYEKDGEKLSGKIKEGYKAYLSKNKLAIKKQLDKSSIFQFDMQGEVRSKFEENKLNATEFLSRCFPQDVDPTPYKTLVINEIDRLVEYLTKKFAIDDDLKKLTKFGVYFDLSQPESLIFEKNLRKAKKKHESWDKIVNSLKHILVEYDQLSKLDVTSDEKDLFLKHVEALREIQKKYETEIDEVENENDRIESVATVIDRVIKNHTRCLTDAQKKRTAFSDRTTELIQTIVELQKKMRELKPYTPFIEKTEVSKASNRVHDYEFISKLNVDIIDTEYFLTRLSEVLKSGKTIDWKTITEDSFKDILMKYDGSSVLDFIRKSLLDVIEADFSAKHAIISQGMDKSIEFSAGMDSKIYFDILSYESTKDGIYIIDQPEDNVSQIAIKTYLLSCFKEMGENRQVIIVTHNPQFIVNLDIDNLIFISKRNGSIQIQSGALEYSCPDYDILDIVANNIDGGLESIQKRWKRYEKANRV